MDKIKAEPPSPLSDILERLKRNGVLKPTSKVSVTNRDAINNVRVKPEFSKFGNWKGRSKNVKQSLVKLDNDTDDECLQCRNCGTKLEHNLDESSIEKLICYKCQENEIMEYSENDTEPDVKPPKKRIRRKATKIKDKDCQDNGGVFYFCTECRRNYSSLDYLKDHGFNVHQIRQRQRIVKNPRRKRLNTSTYSIIKHHNHYVLLVTDPLLNSDVHRKLPTKFEITEMLNTCLDIELSRINCPNCFEVFSSIDDMKIHLSTHTEDENVTRRLTCKECGSIFKTFFLLQKHFSESHLNEINDDKNNDANHDKKDADNNKIDKGDDDNNDDDVDDMESLKEFIKSFRSDDDDEEDDDDEFEIAKIEPLENDIDSNTDEIEEEWLLDENGSVYDTEEKKPFVSDIDKDKACAYCHEVFKTPLLKNVHEEFRHKLLKNANATNEDYVLRNGTKLFCNICQTFFATRRTFTRHLMFKHNKTINIEEYRCRLCPETFRLSLQRTHHERGQHLNPITLQYDCDQCDKFYQRPELLKSHKTTHNEEKMFICDQCGRSYALQKYLQQHRELHFQSYEHICKECNRVFKSAYNLTKHMNVHDPKSRQKCDKCDKTFSDPRDLKRHKFSHGNYKKEFSCNLCSYEAYLKPDLNRHYRTNHKVFQPEHKTRTAIY